MNKLAVVITTPPESNLSVTAIEYIESALDSGVEVIGVFFYQSGVMHANAKIQIASDEYQAIQHWQRLSNKYQLPLHLCITAAEKHGMSDEYADSIHNIFTISGLGELVELQTHADRMMQF